MLIGFATALLALPLPLPQRPSRGRGGERTAAALPGRHTGGDRLSGELARPVAEGGAPRHHGPGQPGAEPDPHHPVRGESGTKNYDDCLILMYFFCQFKNSVVSIFINLLNIKFKYLK